MLSAYRGNSAAVAPAMSGKPILVELSSVAPDGSLTVSGTLTLSAMTQGSVLFAGSSGAVSQDNANLFWDDANKMLGIGTSAPTEKLHTTLFGSKIYNTGAANRTLIRASDDATGPQSLIYKARGTIESPTALQTGNTAGTLLFNGYNGSTYPNGQVQSSVIVGAPAVNWTNTNQQARFFVSTVPSGSTTAVTRWRIGPELFMTTDNTWDIGATDANRPRDMYLSSELRIGDASALVKSSVNMNDGAGAGAGTLTNSPRVGNPTKWIPIIDNGVTRYLPTW